MRIFNITSDFDGKDGLCVEKDYGVKHVLTPQELKELFQKELGDNQCKIKLVVLMIPNSEKIASVFKEIGVSHVLAFEQLDNKVKDIDEYHLLML